MDFILIDMRQKFLKEKQKRKKKRTRRETKKPSKNAWLFFWH
jgi:hypothetical protein